MPLSEAELEVLRQKRDAALAELRSQVVAFRFVREQYLMAESDWHTLKKRYEDLERSYALETKLRKVQAKPPEWLKPPKERLERITTKLSNRNANSLLAELEALIKRRTTPTDSKPEQEGGR